MNFKIQAGLLLDLIADVVEEDQLTANEKQDIILDMLDKNDRYEESFVTFLEWFKMEGPEDGG